MKLINLHEDVVDLSKRREQKQKEQVKMPSVTVPELLADIDGAIELTIGDLIHRGMSQEEAARIVMKHVSDIVMGHDLS